MSRTDLYVAGDLATFALETVRPTDVNLVMSTEPQTVEVAANLGFRALLTPPAKGEIVPPDAGRAAVSVHFPRIFDQEAIGRYEKIYNLHPGFLPWGRGFFPMFWALWDNTPAGATLHEITRGLDAGPIVRQTRVDYTDADTWGTLFFRIREAEKDLFRVCWPLISSGQYPTATPQPPGGSYHSRKDFYRMKRWRDWSAQNSETVVKLVRCLTFPGFTGLELELGGRPFSLGLAPMEDGGAEAR